MLKVNKIAFRNLEMCILKRTLRKMSENLQKSRELIETLRKMIFNSFGKK